MNLPNQKENPAYLPDSFYLYGIGEVVDISERIADLPWMIGCRKLADLIQNPDKADIDTGAPIDHERLSAEYAEASQLIKEIGSNTVPITLVVLFSENRDKAAVIPVAETEDKNYNRINMGKYIRSEVPQIESVVSTINDIARQLDTKNQPFSAIIVQANHRTDRGTNSLEIHYKEEQPKFVIFQDPLTDFLKSTQARLDAPEPQKGTVIE